MTNLARYHGRAPRYILDTDDDSLIRVAGPHQTPWEEATGISDVSLTGLAFTAPKDLSPLLGEVIKIQFIPPGSKQLASHAIIVRIEEVDDHRNKIAAQFYKMEMGHRLALAQGLMTKIKDQVDLGLISESKLSRLRPYSKIILWTGIYITALLAYLLFLKF